MRRAKTDPKADILNQLNYLKSDIKKLATENVVSGHTPREDKLFLYGPPVSPYEFIQGKEFLNNASTNVVFPWIIDDLEEIFSGEFHAPKYQTVVELAGTGSGKAYFAALCDVYCWYWLLSFRSLREYFREKNVDWDDNAVTTFINMAPTKKQAEIIFDSIRKFMNQIQTLKNRGWLPDSNVKSELIYNTTDSATGDKQKKIVITPGNSSETFTLGHAVFGGIIDEACFWREKNQDPAEELYKEMDSRRYSRFKENGLVVLLSSANVDGSFVEQLADHSRSDPKIFCRRRSRYQCKPDLFNLPTFELTVPRERADGTIEQITLHPPQVLKDYYTVDLYKALRDIDAIPSVAGQPFYRDFQLLLAKVNKDRTDPCPDLGKDKSEGPMDTMTRLENFRGIPGVKYRIHVDLAKGAIVNGQCGVGFAMAHKRADPNFGFKIVLDIACRFKAPSGQEIKIGEILDFIKCLKDAHNFDIDMVTFDQWQSRLAIQIINEWRGTTGKEVPVGYREHVYLKNLIYQGQLDFHYDQNLLFELKRLEDYETSVEPGINSYKDESDAVAGVCYSAGALDPTDKESEVLKPRAIRGVTVSRGMVLPNKAGLGKYRSDTGLGRYRGKI